MTVHTKGKGKAKSTDKWKSGAKRGHRTKFCDKESLLCDVACDPVVSIVARDKLSLDDLLKNVSLIEKCSKAKVKKDCVKLLKEGWTKEFELNFKVSQMIDGKLDLDRSLGWAQAVCKCLEMGFENLDEKMIQAAEFITKNKEVYGDFLKQWELFPIAKDCQKKDAWYGCSSAAEWKKDHIKPAVIRPWVELTAKSKDAQIAFYDNFMDDTEKTQMGHKKPYEIGNTITTSYLNNAKECFHCKQCGVENWHGMHIFFDQVTNKNAFHKDQCGVLCRECVLEGLKGRDIDAETNSHVFHGLTNEPNPFRACPAKDCKRGCVIQSFKEVQMEYLAENLCIEVGKLREVMERGAVEQIVRLIKESECYYNKTFEPNAEKPDDYSHKLNRTKINQINTKISKIKGWRKQQEIRTQLKELNHLYYQYELSYHMYILKKGIAKAEKECAAEEWDKMFTEVDCCQSAINSIKSYARYSKKDKVFGMSQESMLLDWLKGKKAQVQLCVRSADRCGICMSTKSAKESDMLDMHPKGDPALLNRPIACKACPDCFDNFVNHTSALGKPCLKCPGAACGRLLKTDHVKDVAPGSYDKYERALMRFQLKKVKNYKFCPNGHGFLTYENCEASSMCCPTCTINFCPGCGSQPHQDIGNGSCLDFLKHQHKARWHGKAEVDNDEKEKEEKNAEEKFFTEIGDLSKQCLYCGVWIEKNGGCQHMTCVHCRGEFCWLCDGQWKGHTSCETPIKICRPYFHEVFPKKVFDDEEEEEWETDSEVNSECSENYGHFLECFRRAWEPPGAESFNINYGHAEYLEDVYYAQYLRGLRSECSDDSSDESYETDSECFVNDFATEIQYFNFIEGFNCEDQWKPPVIKYANRYKNFMCGFKNDSDSESDSTDSRVFLDFNTDTIPAYLFPVTDSVFGQDPGQNMFPNSEEEESSSEEQSVEQSTEQDSST